MLSLIAASTILQAGERALTKSVVVSAPVAEVWKSWTTAP